MGTITVLLAAYSKRLANSRHLTEDDDSDGDGNEMKFSQIFSMAGEKQLRGYERENCAWYVLVKRTEAII